MGENESSQKQHFKSIAIEEEEKSNPFYLKDNSSFEIGSDYSCGEEVSYFKPQIPSDLNHVKNKNSKELKNYLLSKSTLSKIDSSKFSKTIILYFPFSCSKKNIENCDLLTENGGFEMSYNDAINSEIVRNLIELDDNYFEDQDEDNIDDKIHITIPRELYKGMRFCDLLIFIHLWIGKECFSKHLGASQYVPTIYDWHSVCRIIGALGMNRDLRFVKDIEKTYPPPEILQKIIKQNDEMRANWDGTPN
jgi:hypothetical protein